MIRLVMMVLFVLAMFLPAAQAEDFEWTACYSGTYTGFHDKKELTPVFSWQQNGILMSDDKRFNNITFHCEGVQVGIGENRNGYSLCTYKDVDGDMIIGGGPYTGLIHDEKFLEGTGKWKGIKGGISESKRLVRNRPNQEAMPGTYQGCRTEKGTLELPK